MLVFIGNIPGDTSLVEIQQLVRNRELTVEFSAHHINCIDKADFYYVLAKMESEEATVTLIERLNGQKFKGTALEARQFIKRQPTIKWPGANRRNAGSVDRAL